jgi:hypothetical protein
MAGTNNVGMAGLYAALQAERRGRSGSPVGRLPPLQSLPQPKPTPAEARPPQLLRQQHQHQKQLQQHQLQKPNAALRQESLSLERRSAEVAALQVQQTVRSKTLAAQRAAASSALPPVRDLHRAWLTQLPGTHVLLQTYAACGRVYRYFIGCWWSWSWWRQEGRCTVCLFRELSQLCTAALFYTCAQAVQTRAGAFAVAARSAAHRD